MPLGVRSRWACGSGAIAAVRLGGPEPDRRPAGEGPHPATQCGSGPSGKWPLEWSTRWPSESGPALDVFDAGHGQITAFRWSALTTPAIQYVVAERRLETPLAITHGEERLFSHGTWWWSSGLRSNLWRQLLGVHGLSGLSPHVNTSDTSVLPGNLRLLAWFHLSFTAGLGGAGWLAVAMALRRPVRARKLPQMEGNGLRIRRVI